MWEILADSSTQHPSFHLLQMAFEDYRMDARPAGASPKNQCAIRMSLALGRCGFSLSAFPHPHRVVSKHGLPVPYVQGARELADYLKTIWGSPTVFRNNLGTVAQR